MGQVRNPLRCCFWTSAAPGINNTLGQLALTTGDTVASTAPMQGLCSLHELANSEKVSWVQDPAGVMTDAAAVLTRQSC
jgi:hypothetical protein